MAQSKTADDGATERRVLLAAVAEAEGHGDHADDHGEGGHEDRAEAGEAGFDGGADGITVMQQAFLGEGHDQNAVGGGDAHAHDGAHQRRNAERGARDEEEKNDSGERRGKRGDDDERIEPGLEVDDDEQVDEHDGEDAGRRADR